MAHLSLLQSLAIRLSDAGNSRSRREPTIFDTQIQIEEEYLESVDLKINNVDRVPMRKFFLKKSSYVWLSDPRLHILS